MKKIFSFAVAAICVFSSVNVMAQEPFFLNKVGAEAEYVIKDGKGNVQSYMKTVVTEVTGEKITYTAEVFDKNKKAMGTPVTASVDIVDGAIVTDPSAAMAGMNAKFEGTYPSFPANLSVGQKMEYSYTMKMGMSKTTTTGTNTVSAKESVTTEAGTFDCYKVDSEISVKVMMQTNKMTMTAWYANGIGAVKSETYDSKGNVETVQELISVKK